MARKGSYLYKRKGSENFWLRLVYPPELALVLGKARIERSLGVSNRIEAEAKASEEIRKHKLSLFAVQRMREGKPQPVGAQKRFPPMTEHFLDGFRVVATDDELIFFDANSNFVRKEANFLLVDLTNTIEFALNDVSRPWLSHGTAKTARRFMKPEDTKADDDILERWIRHRKITPT